MRMDVNSKSLSFWAFLVSMTMVIFTNFNLARWNRLDTIVTDVIEYYGYLPASFIEQDLALKFHDQKSIEQGKKYWYHTTPEGNRVFRFTMGLSFLYAPFFLVAHLYANTAGVEPTGFTVPYHFSVALSCLFYLFWGLWLLRKVLLTFYSEIVTAFTLLLVVLATNLFFYVTNMPGMSHAYNFSLVSGLLWLTIKWHEKPAYWHSLFIGIILGLLLLIRPVNGLFILIPVLYGLNSKFDLVEKWKLMQTHVWHLVLASLAVFFVVLPQLVYWKYVTGSFIYYSYGEEKFFFSEPIILRGLFGFRKGWYIYTPVMLFATIGIGWVRKHAKNFFWPIAVFMPINIWILMSWWCWWYGGGYGQRTLIDSYPLMAFGLASFLSIIFALKQKLIRVGMVVLMFLLLGLNQIQTAQARWNCIHYDSMNMKYYFAVFCRIPCPPSAKDLLTPPDYNAALKGNRKQ